MINLPVEIISIILSFLDDIDLCNISKICKVLYQVSNNDRLWKVLADRTFCFQKNHEVNTKEQYRDIVIEYKNNKLFVRNHFKQIYKFYYDDKVLSIDLRKFLIKNCNLNRNPSDIRLFWTYLHPYGKVLLDNFTIKEYNIPSNSSLFVDSVFGPILFH